MEFQYPALVKFSADWCGPCKVLQKKIDVLKAQHQRVNFYEVDVDEEQELASMHSVRSLPTVIFFDSSGTVVKTVVGVMPEATYASELQKL